MSALGCRARGVPCISLSEGDMQEDVSLPKLLDAFYYYRAGEGLEVHQFKPFISYIRKLNRSVSSPKPKSILH